MFKPFRPQVLERRIRQLLTPEESPEARLAPLPTHKNLYSLPRRVAALPAPDSRRPGTGLALWLQTRSFQLASK